MTNIVTRKHRIADIPWCSRDKRSANFGVVTDSDTPKIHQPHVCKRKTAKLFFFLGTALVSQIVKFRI